MKYAIYPEKQGTITADSENAAYPATNLNNEYRTKVWKAVAEIQTAELTVPISAISSVLGIFNTNATSGTITIMDGATVVLAATPITMTNGRYWQEYTSYASSCVATISLTTTGTTVECGSVRAGILRTVSTGALVGMTETIRTYSIRDSMRNGSFYGKKLERVRVFTYGIMATREIQFRALMDLFDHYDIVTPFAMLLSDVSGYEDEYAVFGYFDKPPSANHNNPTWSPVSIVIIEGV